MPRPKSLTTLQTWIATAIVGLLLLCVPVFAHADKPPTATTTVQTSAVDVRLHYLERYKPAVSKLADITPKYIGAMRKHLGAFRTGPLEVWVLPNVNEYFERKNKPSRAPSWAIGVTLSDTLIVLSQGAANGVDELERTYKHELVHAAINQRDRRRHIPRWFHEGVAIYLADEWNPKRSERLAQAAASSTLIPLNKMRNGFPSHHNRASLAYAQSFHLVRHLVQTHGPNAVKDVLTHVSEGMAFSEAFESATQVPFVQFRRQWKASIPEAVSIWSILRQDTVLLIAVLIVSLIIMLVRGNRSRSAKKSEAESTGKGLSYDQDAYPLPGDPSGRE